MKHDLVIDKNWKTGHSFIKWCYELLIKSEMFNVFEEDMKVHRKLDDIKSKLGKLKFLQLADMSFFKIDGKMIVLDTWSSASHAKAFADLGLFKGLNHRLYIKIHETEEIKRLYGYKTFNWIIFPCGDQFVNKTVRKDSGWKYDTFFTSGPHSLRTQKRFYWYDHCLKSDRMFATNQKLSTQEFIDVMGDSKFGLITSIRNYKNTREYEFISNGMPLVLNYRPKYDFPFEPNKHYLFMTNPNDLVRLRTLNHKPFADASKYIWENYYRPEAAAKYLISALS
ncbi:hypothetical protein CCP1ISM_90009 [Azospirillaceae bacterium]